MTEKQITPQEVIGRLERLDGELTLRADQLHQIEVALESVEEEYEKFVDEFELGLLLKSETSEYKLPSAALRLKMARRTMDPQVLGKYEGYLRKRKRLETRIRLLSKQVDAQRSILSTLKVLEQI